MIKKYFIINMLSLFLLSTAIAGDDKNIKAKPAMTVTTTTVSKADWAATIETQGAIMAWQEAIVSARVAGLPIAEIVVNVGDQVKKGDVLAVFDDRTVRAEIAQAEATIAQNTASLKQAAANSQRAVTLKKSNLISDQDELNATTQAKTTSAQKAVAEAALANLKIRLEHTRILAPDDGVITAQTVVLGQVPALGAELFRLIRQNRLEWRAELTAQQLAQLKIGMNAQIILLDKSIVYGKIRQLAPALDANSRLGIAYIDLQTGSAAKAGMFANGRIDIQQSPALIVPAESVVIRDGRSSLFLLKENNRVQQLTVDTGRRQDKFIEILQGIKENDTIIVRGAGFLNDGDLIKVIAQ
jgi:RND family efflux transporter MFP subunit